MTISTLGSYNYDDPDNDWQGECATGSKQSPIDVITPSENEGKTGILRTLYRDDEFQPSERRQYTYNN